MKQDKGGYNSIFKGTAIFGGVQILNILVNLIRGKFIALLLGPSGMGVYALLNSSVNTISQLSGLGLNMSAVKDISVAYEENNQNLLCRVICAFRKLVLFTGLLGGAIMLLSSPWLSDSAFGNRKYVFTFIILSIVVFFTSLTNGEVALLQGTRKLRELAYSSIIGSLAGLIVGIPLYYFMREDGIALAMIAFAVVTFVINRYYARHIELVPMKVSTEETVQIGCRMLSLGIALTISNLLGSVTIYLINTYISRWGNISDLGLYQAAISITNQYVGLVFAAMAVDYFPRLASIANNNDQVREVANKQMEIVILLVVPLIMTLIITSPLIITILLTKDFFSIIPLLRLMGIGLFFKALAFPLGYISFAKGDKYVFFWLEGICSNLLNLVSSIVCYRIWGLEGLGISFFSTFCIYLIIIYFVTRLRYKYQFDDSVRRLFLPSLFFVVTVFLLFIFINNMIGYVIGLILLSVSGWFSYRELNRRIDIGSFFRAKFNKSA